RFNEVAAETLRRTEIPGRMLELRRCFNEVAAETLRRTGAAVEYRVLQDIASMRSQRKRCEEHDRCHCGGSPPKRFNEVAAETLRRTCIEYMANEIKSGGFNEVAAETLRRTTKRDVAEKSKVYRLQ